MAALAYACSYCSRLSATLYSSCRVVFQFETLHYPWIPRYLLYTIFNKIIQFNVARKLQ